MIGTKIYLKKKKKKGKKWPETDIKISLKKINLPSNFLNFTFLNFVQGSNLSNVAQFPTTKW